MEYLQEQWISCPYCGEDIEVLLDQQEAGHQYIEDCQVCCQPIIFDLDVNPQGELSVRVRTDNDTF